jgi:hypothetical protein
MPKHCRSSSALARGWHEQPEAETIGLAGDFEPARLRWNLAILDIILFIILFIIFVQRPFPIRLWFGVGVLTCRPGRRRRHPAQSWAAVL